MLAADDGEEPDADAVEQVRAGTMSAGLAWASPAQASVCFSPSDRADDHPASGFLQWPLVFGWPPASSPSQGSAAASSTDAVYDVARTNLLNVDTLMKSLMAGATRVGKGGGPGAAPEEEEDELAGVHYSTHPTGSS